MKHTRDLAQSTILRSIAESFERSARPFAVENHRLAHLNAIDAVDTPVPRHAIAPNVWIDFEADTGVDVTMSPGEGAEGMRLLLRDRGQSRWVSFSYDVDIDAVRRARYLGMVIRAHSTGIAAFRTCIRYIFDGSFQDRFSPQMLVFPGGFDEQLCFIKPDPVVMGTAKRVEILFFFEGKRFDITFLGIENMQI